MFFFSLKSIHHLLNIRETSNDTVFVLHEGMRLKKFSFNSNFVVDLEKTDY